MKHTTNDKCARLNRVRKEMLMTSNRDSRNLAMLIAMFTLITVAPALALEHAVTGVMTRVDSTAKTVAVKTADGTEEVFKFTGKTVVRGADGAKAGAVDTYLAGKEGTHVVVRYTDKGAEKTATGIDDVGKDGVKVTRGTISGIDKAGHKITVATEDGSKETYHLGKDAAVDTGHGVAKGEKVTVHYTVAAGKKVAHLIKGI
jgi:lipopolysaccharide export system protein LptA